MFCRYSMWIGDTDRSVLVAALKTHGVDKIFGVPGESYLSVLDALYDVRDHIEFEEW